MSTLANNLELATARDDAQGKSWAEYEADNREFWARPLPQSCFRLSARGLS